MFCSAVFDGVVCGKEHFHHHCNFPNSSKHVGGWDCHPYQEEESPMTKNFEFAIAAPFSAYGDIIYVERTTDGLLLSIGKNATDCPIGNIVRITPKALREIADTLEEDTEIIRKTITL